MIQLLEPFFDATEILSSSTYPTISDMRLTIIGLLQHLDSFIQCNKDLNEHMIADSINFKLQEYWNYMEISTTISTLLDSRSKTKTFMDIKKCDEAIMLLQNQMIFYKDDISLNQNILPIKSRSYESK